MSSWDGLGMGWQYRQEAALLLWFVGKACHGFLP